MDVLHIEESIYNVCERHVFINRGFYAYLQEHHKDNITQFLALPKVIPTRKKKQQWPLLDFTKSKILTFAAYTQSSKELLAQRVVHQAEAKRNGAEEAMIENRQKKKADCQQ